MSTAVFGAPEFRARSGRTVRANGDGSVTFQGVRGYLGPEQVFDAEEFFQARRDAELGRWRWPENPDWVVTPTGNPDEVSVLNEREAAAGSFLLSRGSSNWPHAKPAADAYFEAHPVRKPWEDAKPGEVWVLVINGEEHPAIVDAAYDFTTAQETFAFGSEDMKAVEDARRIWPEDAS